MRSSFYVTEKLGPKQSLTPEGFLLCEEVPLARTGMMIYGPDETPIKAGPEGIVKIFREPADVFTPQTIGSAQGKPVTNDHPEEDVTPGNWRDLSHGTMLNVRRGVGAMDDLLIGDLLVTTPEGIDAVRSGKTEVSLGYEADYEETALGVGKQSNIIINHIALVDQGRCGPRCAISDRQPDQLRSTAMAKKPSKILDAMLKAFKAKDAAEVEQIAKQVEDELPEAATVTNGDTHIHVHTGSDPALPMTGNDQEIPGSTAGSEGGTPARVLDDEALQAHIDQNAAEHAEMREMITALQQQVAALQAGEAAEHMGDEAMPEGALDEIPEEFKEEAKKAKDSAYLMDSFQDTVAKAEILVPGIRIPTVDRASKPGDSYKRICGFRRQALDLAYVQPATRAFLEDALQGKELDTKNMTCDAVRTLFNTAAASKAAANNAGGGHKTGDSKPAVQAPLTLAEVNRRNAARYASN